jgi:hypothetical protein
MRVPANGTADIVVNASQQDFDVSFASMETGAAAGGVINLERLGLR